MPCYCIIMKVIRPAVAGMCKVNCITHYCQSRRCCAHSFLCFIEAACSKFFIRCIECLWKRLFYAFFAWNCNILPIISTAILLAYFTGLVPAHAISYDQQIAFIAQYIFICNPEKDAELSLLVRTLPRSVLTTTPDINRICAPGNYLPYDPWFYFFSPEHRTMDFFSRLYSNELLRGVICTSISLSL